MALIEVSDKIKKRMDKKIKSHNDMVKEYPNSVAAAVGLIDYTYIIEGLYQDRTRSSISSMNDSDFGRQFGT